MALIDIRELTFSYGSNLSTPVLNNISFSVDEGDFVLLCGPSACGKTTLLKLIKHLIAPYGTKTGTISVMDKNVDELSEYDLVSQIGYVFQNPDHQIVCEKPFAELAFGLENLGLDSNEIRHRVAEMASFFGIEHYFSRNVNELSGGQKQLLNLASVMLMQPKVLLLDEPTAMLDPICTDEFLHMLDKVNKEMGLTIVICEHNLERVYSLVDKICLMENGTVKFSGNPENGAAYMLEQKDVTSLSLPSSAALFNKYGNNSSKVPFNVKEGKLWLKSLPPLQLEEIIKKESKQNRTVDISKNPVAFTMKNVYYRYSKHGPFVLDNINLTGYQGEILTIVGGNGTGKSTLLSVLSRYRKPTAGKINTGKIGYLPQDPSLLFSEDTVGLEISNTVFKSKLDPAKANELADSFPSIARILNNTDTNPLDLSGGQKQLLAFYKLALYDIEVLILDEPVKGLDGLAKKELYEILKKFQSKGICIVIVTHDLEFAALVSNRIGMMFDNDIISLDTPKDFFTSNYFYTTSRCKISRGILDGLY